jgi:hypothetical protein
MFQAIGCDRLRLMHDQSNVRLHKGSSIQRRALGATADTSSGTNAERPNWIPSEVTANERCTLARCHPKVRPSPERTIVIGGACTSNIGRQYPDAHRWVATEPSSLSLRQVSIASVGFPGIDIKIQRTLSHHHQRGHHG